jgi:hypothetical protein
MTGLKQAHSFIRLCFKVGENAAETSETLKVAFGQ